MPGTEYLSHHHDSVNTTRSMYLVLPQESVDRAASPHRPRSARSALSPSPEPGRRHHRKRAKSVHWDLSVVDNEHKMQSRPQKSEAVEHPSKAHGASAKPSEHASSVKPPAANRSLKLDPSHSRQPSDYRFIKSRRPVSPPPSRHSRAPTHQPSRTPGVNSSSKIVSSSKKSPIKFRKAPPVVPDPPKSDRPPPAPRPSRLPTPDLPEIDEAKFFVAKDKLFDFSRGRSDHRGRPIHQKTDDQLEAAVAYMQERKRRGN